MAIRSVRPVTVTLGEMGARAEQHVRSGRYASVSEVMRAGLRALDREEIALDTLLKARVEQALRDPRPPVGIDAAFDSLRAAAAARRETRGR